MTLMEEIVMKTRPTAFVCAAMIAATGLVAANPVLAKPVHTSLIGNVAAGGYDVTSYFTGNGAPKKGSKAFAVKHGGAVYHFASAANAATFKGNPGRYAPQYGGYCAWAMSNGYQAPGDPNYYRVVGGKLYLNYNRSVQEKWSKDIPALISKGDGNWAKLP